MPLLENVYRNLKDKGFMLLAITDEDPVIVQRFVKQFKIGLPVLIDRTRIVFDHYGIQALPSTTILDRKGRPTARLNAISEGLLRESLTSAGITP
jgi:peroxiredoxin